MLIETLKLKFKHSTQGNSYRSFWQCIHIDTTLFALLVLLSVLGLLILYSASNQHPRAIEYQTAHFVLAFIAMFIIAQISPDTLRRLAPLIYCTGLILLIIASLMGHIGKGGQRWLNIGFMHLQPSEIMKLGIPLFLAWYFHKIPLPIREKSFLIALPVILIPAIITAKQPDLGTGIILAISGTTILFIAGLSWRFILGTVAFLLAIVPFGWIFLYNYQQQRILTLFNPERDPLGTGYHIIQSKIAIGSGGLFGKGWLGGTQSSLHFLPEHTTDFIFAVGAEEFGFIGSLFLMIILMLIVMRGLIITINAQDTFSRLIAGSITFTFFISFFINIGMVAGILPVVGIPLPLISYGGSSMMTIMASFGILMSIHTHRKLVTT